MWSTPVDRHRYEAFHYKPATLICTFDCTLTQSHFQGLQFCVMDMHFYTGDCFQKEVTYMVIWNENYVEIDEE